MTLSDKLIPVARETLQDRVYRELSHAIMTGQFAPGETLTIRSLADALGTSVMPVREALQKLAAEGVLEPLPNRSLRVQTASRTSVHELYQIRKSLEGMATRMAAKKLSDDDLEALAGYIAKMESCTKEEDADAFLIANQAFHFHIYAAADSHHLMPMIRSLWLKFGPLISRPFRQHRISDKQLVAGQKHHKNILAALRKRDGVKAEAALLQDLGDAERWFEQHHVFPGEEARA